MLKMSCMVLLVEDCICLVIFLCLVGLVAEVSTVLPGRYVTGDVDVRAGVVLVRLHTAALLAHDLLPQKTLDNIFLGILDYNTNTSVYLISYSMLDCWSAFTKS